METFYVILLFVPFILILWLANRSEEALVPATMAAADGTDGTDALAVAAARSPRRGGRPTGALLAYLLLVALYGLMIMAGLSSWLVGVVAGSPLAREAGLALPPELDAAMLAAVGLGLWLPSVFGLMLLLPPVRRLVGRLLPDFRATSPVHAVALSYSALILINLLTTIGAGLDNLADMLEQAGPVNLVPSLWAQEIAMAFMALVGVGWLTRRRLRDGLRRLAIVRPGPRQVVAGLAVGAGLGIAVVVLEMGLARVGIMNDANVERLSEQLLGPLIRQPFGVMTLGVAAALGEESLFRGALQPRFGLFLTALLFALLHSNYGLTLATAIVFGVGLLLGIVRQRTNTTTSMIVHATYNITLGLIAASGLFK
ncbi:MAG: CPBP family intramembrane metalloprotease [Anaerolineae bacterium]|nr:CPBP family intramembrane metalloprotease [Anaerolineae bacterium]